MINAHYILKFSASSHSIRTLEALESLKYMLILRSWRELNGCFNHFQFGLTAARVDMTIR